MLEASVDGGLETDGLSQILELASGCRLFPGVALSLARLEPKELNGFSSQPICPKAVGKLFPDLHYLRTSFRYSWAWLHPVSRALIPWSRALVLDHSFRPQVRS